MAFFGPSGITSNVEASLAEIPLMQGKPRLQRTGTGLETFDITLNFHAKFCNPDNEYRRLREYFDTSEILPFINGNGEIYGDFVIKSIGRTFNRKFSDGTTLFMNVEIQLIEFVGQVQESEPETVALDSDNPATVEPNILPAGDTFSAGAEVVQVNALNTAAAGNMAALNAVSVFRPQVEKIIKQVNQAASGALAIKTTVDANPDTQLYTVTRQLSTACQEIITLSVGILSEANDLLTAIDSNDGPGIAASVAALIGDSQDLIQRNKDMLTASAGLNQLILTGKS